jgi:hypothetical protein
MSGIFSQHFALSSEEISSVFIINDFSTPLNIRGMFHSNVICLEPMLVALRFSGFSDTI